MGSINAQRVAMKVSDNIRMGRKVVLGEIIKDVGYSEQTSLKPKLVTQTDSYIKSLEIERKPLLEMIEKEIADIQLAISKKNKNKEEYRTLVGSLDIHIRNRQLLTGGATSRNILVLPSEVIERNNIETNTSQTLTSEKENVEVRIESKENN